MASDLLQDPDRKALDKTRIYDGFNDLSGGADSARSPEVLRASRYAFGVNIVSRDGMPRTRAPFVRLELTPSTGADFDAWRTGYHQGSAAYYNPVSGVSAIVSAIGGRIFSVDPSTGELRNLSGTPPFLNDANATHYFCQAESFMVINNGQDTPIIFDGGAIRRATAEEVPTGTIMAYGQGRLFVASPDRMSFMACDLVYGGSVNSVDIKLSARVIVAGDPKAQLTTTADHGFTEGDTVSIGGHFSTPNINGTYKVEAVPSSTTFQISAVLTSGGSGGNVAKANDGKESDVLRATETNYQNERGVFRLPAKMGRITAMTFFAVQDTATGQGDLIVFGERGACSFAVSAPRTNWLNIQLQRQTFANIGCTGPNAIANVNGDIFFRSWDGIRSYRNARAEQNSYGQVPISGEIRRALNGDTPTLLPAASMALFDNRLLTAAQPKEILPATGRARSVFQCLIPLDFDQVSRLAKEDFASYDGIWNGLNVQQVLAGNFGPSSAGLIVAYEFDGVAYHNEIWKVRPDLIGGDRWVNCAGATVEVPIKCALESRAFVFEKPMRQKKLIRADVWIANLLGSAAFRVYWRPDLHPAGWFHWLTFQAGSANCAQMEAVSPCCLTPGCGSANSFMPQVSLGTPPAHEDKATNRRADHGYSFQLRVEWDGSAQIVKSLLCAVEVAESMTGKLPAGAIELREASPANRETNPYTLAPTACDLGTVPPVSNCITLAAMVHWPVGKLRLSIVNNGSGAAAIRALEGEYILCASSPDTGVWSLAIGAGSLRAIANAGGARFDIVYIPTTGGTQQYIGAAPVDVNCVPSPVVALSSTFPEAVFQSLGTESGQSLGTEDGNEISIT